MFRVVVVVNKLSVVVDTDEGFSVDSSSYSLKISDVDVIVSSVVVNMLVVGGVGEGVAA